VSRAAAGFRLYGNVVPDDVDAANYCQQLRELQDYIIPPQSASVAPNKLPLSSVMSLPEETALRVRFIWNLRTEAR